MARKLPAARSLEAEGAGRAPVPVTLIERAPVPPDLTADSRVAAICGDLWWPADAPRMTR